MEYLRNEFLWGEVNGELCSFFIMEIGKDGWIKIQQVSSEKVMTEVEYLKDWMKKNNYNNVMLSDILDVSPSTVSRWLNYEHAIPREVFKNLKIDIDNLSTIVRQSLVSGVRSHANSIINNLDKLERGLLREQMYRNKK